MGKNRRLHAAKVLARNEKAREQVSGVAVSALKKKSTKSQIEFLLESLSIGHLSVSKLRKVFAQKAPKEMQEGAERLIKKGITPTVELLMGDYLKEPKFRELTAYLGLDEKWFTELARAECKRWEHNNGRN